MPHRVFVLFAFQFGDGGGELVAGFVDVMKRERQVRALGQVFSAVVCEQLVVLVVLYFVDSIVGFIVIWHDCFLQKHVLGVAG